MIETTDRLFSANPMMESIVTSAVKNHRLNNQPCKCSWLLPAILTVNLLSFGEFGFAAESPKLPKEASSLIADLGNSVRQRRSEEWDANDKEMRIAIELLSKEQERQTIQKSLDGAKQIQVFIKKANACKRSADLWQHFKSAGQSDLPENCSRYVFSTLQKISSNKASADEEILEAHQDVIMKLNAMLEKLAASAMLDEALLVRQAVQDLEKEVTALQHLHDESSESETATVATVLSQKQHEIDEVLDDLVLKLRDCMRPDLWRMLKNKSTRKRKIEMLQELLETSNKVSRYPLLSADCHSEVEIQLNAIQEIESKYDLELESAKKKTRNNYQLALTQCFQSWDAKNATIAWLRIHERPLPGQAFEVESDLPPVPEVTKSAFDEFNEAAAQVDRDFDSQADEICKALIAELKAGSQDASLTEQKAIVTYFTSEDSCSLIRLILFPRHLVSRQTSAKLFDTRFATARKLFKDRALAREPLQLQLRMSLEELQNGFIAEGRVEDAYAVLMRWNWLCRSFPPYDAAAKKTPRHGSATSAAILAVKENGCLIRFAGDSESIWHPRILITLKGDSGDASNLVDGGDEWYRAEQYSLGEKYANRFRIKLADRVFALRGSRWSPGVVRESRQSSVRVVWDDLPHSRGELVDANYVRFIPESSIFE